MNTIRIGKELLDFIKTNQLEHTRIECNAFTIYFHAYLDNDFMEEIEYSFNSKEEENHIFRRSWMKVDDGDFDFNEYEITTEESLKMRGLG